MVDNIKVVREVIELCAVRERFYYGNEFASEEALAALSQLTCKETLIEKLEAEKYTPEQGMDREMECHNGGVQAAIEIIKGGS